MVRAGEQLSIRNNECANGTGLCVRQEAICDMRVTRHTTGAFRDECGRSAELDLHSSEHPTCL